MGDLFNGPLQSKHSYQSFPLLPKPSLTLNIKSAPADFSTSVHLATSQQALYNLVIPTIFVLIIYWKLSNFTLKLKC